MADTGRRGPSFAFIGFSEAGQAIGGGLHAAGVRVAAYDLRLRDAAAAPTLEERAAALGVVTRSSAKEAAAGAEIIVSAVTAGAALAVAREVASFIARDQVFLDINSISPDDKRAGAAVIEAAGAVYVEAAVISPVGPFGHRVPMLLGGKGAEALAVRLRRLGMSVEVAGETIGAASAIKMCRSIAMKGLEALTVECLMTARHYDVAERVLASLEESFPGFDWQKRAAYMLGRVMAHGARRAEEMRCAAATVSAAGLAPLMADATARRQQWVADLDLAPDTAVAEGALARIDALLAAATKKTSSLS